MIVLDTTILIYAVGDDHRLREPSRALLELVRDGEVRASTTIQVIQEFCHVRARRRPAAEAAARARDYARGLTPLLRTEEGELYQGLDLFEGSSGLSAFDAVLAATALGRGFALASADRAFAQVVGLAHLDPQSPAFLGMARELG